MKTVNSNQFAAEVQSILVQYSTEAQKELKKSMKTIAKDTVQELEEKAPKRTGNYAKGFKSKLTTSKGVTTATVYNENYRLPHLLEYGHANRNGGRTKAIPHFQPAMEDAEKAMEKAVKEAAQNAGFN